MDKDVRGRRGGRGRRRASAVVGDLSGWLLGWCARDVGKSAGDF